MVLLPQYHNPRGLGDQQPQMLQALFFISGPGVISLKHYGKCEVLGKIANMVPEYDEPMYFDPDLLGSATSNVTRLNHSKWCNMTSQ